jgi:8-oxo-dGTP pyrophosphatase MutT (NUDIX family)
MSDLEWALASGARPAAVLLLLYPDPVSGEDTIVFTRRTETLPTHRGQISLPGGSRDPDDPGPEFTALREAQEELGIDPASVQVLGTLPPVPTVVSNYLITPVIGRAERRPDFVPNPHEVAELIEVPLRALRDTAIYHTEERNTPFGSLIMHSYQYGPYNIWGATGRILNVFLAATT